MRQTRSLVIGTRSELALIKSSLRLLVPVIGQSIACPLLTNTTYTQFLELCHFCNYCGLAATGPFFAVRASLALEL